MGCKVAGIVEIAKAKFARLGTREVRAGVWSAGVSGGLQSKSVPITKNVHVLLGSLNCFWTHCPLSPEIMKVLEQIIW